MLELYSRFGLIPVSAALFITGVVITCLIAGAIWRMSIKENIRDLMIPGITTVTIAAILCSVVVQYAAPETLTHKSGDIASQGIARVTDIQFIKDGDTDKEELILTFGLRDADFTYREIVKSEYAPNEISPHEYELFDHIEYVVYETETVQLFGAAHESEDITEVKKILRGKDYVNIQIEKRHI